MANDLKFDALTGDVIPDGKGGLTLTPYADTIMQLQLNCRYPLCWQDDQLGTRFYDLRFFQSNPVVMVPDEQVRALNVLASRGYIDSIKVTAQRTTPNRIDVQGSARDRSSGTIIPALTKLAMGGS